MSRKKKAPPDESSIDATAVGNPWKPSTGVFMRTDEIAFAQALGIDPEAAVFTYTEEERDGVPGLTMNVEEA